MALERIEQDEELTYEVVVYGISTVTWFTVHCLTLLSCLAANTCSGNQLVS